MSSAALKTPGAARGEYVRHGLARRLVDVGVAFLGLMILAPLMLLIMAAIRIESRGPALFRQRRSGMGGREFLIFKFRTMRVLEDGADVLQATRGDSRITRVGRILRRTSLDEIPQLLNVLLGDMALVGPRPHAVAHDRFYSSRVPFYMDRYRARPGITGWAQISGLRGETREIEQMAARVRHDLWYVERQSLKLDIVILLRTPLSLIKDAF